MIIKTKIWEKEFTAENINFFEKFALNIIGPLLSPF